MSKKVKAIIEKGEDGNYSIYLADVAGLYGTGLTEDEAKESLSESLEMAKEHYRESEEQEYAVFASDYVVEYAYDLSGFFKKHDYINASALARKLGINPGLMRRYSSGTAYISEYRKKEIERQIHEIGEELTSVAF